MLADFFYKVERASQEKTWSFQKLVLEQLISIYEKGILAYTLDLMF